MNMSKTKWLILISPNRALHLVLTGAFFIGLFTSCSDSGLPAYKSDQTDSSRAGYRRSTLTSGTDVYVSDYEDAALQLINPEPSPVIGRTAFGNGKICAIPGQPTTAYIAGDVGSEMPAYAVFRNANQPPFDWRTATFREMSFTGLDAGRTYKQTTNTALLAEVIRTLREGTPVKLPAFPFAAVTNLSTLRMSTDQLPGIVFCPQVCVDANGTFYIAESLMMDLKPTPQLHAKWIAVGSTLAEWLKAQ